MPKQPADTGCGPAELQQYRKALQYFVDTFGYHEKWTGPMYMQIHRTEALKLAKSLGIKPMRDGKEVEDEQGKLPQKNGKKWSNAASYPIDDERMISRISNNISER